MFALRTINEKGIEHNLSLSDNYSIVTKENNPDQFKETSKVFWNEPEPENTYGYVIYDSGKIHPLYKGHFNYIMTGSGQTFANITLR